MVFVYLFIYFLYVGEHMLRAPNHNLHGCLIVSAALCANAGDFSRCYPVRQETFLRF